MTRRKRWICTVFAAAVWTAVFSMTALADSGWMEEDGEWAYVKGDGELLTDAWKMSGDSHYYLDENGKMAVSTLVEYGGEKYYVDENGARVTRRWVALPNDGQWDEDIDTIYYYFGSAGKAFRDAKKNIEGKVYFFDGEGHMLSGWHGEDVNGRMESYYLGDEDEGWAYTGWHWLTPEGEADGAEMKWFYFNLNNGKAYRGKKYIHGSYYLFDEETAAMADRWIQGTPGAPDYSAETGKESQAWYEPEAGRLRTGWVYTYDALDEEGGDRYWFYLDGNGAAFNEGGRDVHFGEQVNSGDADSQYTYLGRGLGGEDGGTTYSNLAAKVIDGKTYLFDENGHMLTGFFYLWVVKREGGLKPLGERKLIGNDYGYGGSYYFNEEQGSPREGQMMSGRLKIEKTGDYYHFRDNGMAYERAIVNGFLYMEGGVCETAKDGNKYRVVPITSGEYTAPVIEMGSNRKHTDCLMIVDASGRVKKNGTVTIDGYKYTVKNYEVVGKPVPVE